MKQVTLQIQIGYFNEYLFFGKIKSRMLNMKDKISVVMAEYNTNLDQLEKSIKSIMTQTYRNFELIIIDDMTSETNKNYLNELKNQSSKIKVLTNSSNLGLAASLNKALDYATGDYIFRMDTDDIALPHRFETQLKTLKKGHAITTARVSIIDENDKIVGETRSLPFYNTSKRILLYYFFNNGVIHPLIAAKKEVFDEFRYDESVKYGQDFELWLRMSNKFKIYFDNNILLKYRVSKNIDVDKVMLQYRNYVTKSNEYLGNNLLKRSGYFISNLWRRKYIEKKFNIKI